MLAQLLPMLAFVVVDNVVFVAAAFTTLWCAGAVVMSKNPVHSALWLIVTFFGVAVLFVSLQAHFLAVVQIIVYAGAIVVLFLFVIMLLGVDTTEAVQAESRPFQRQAAFALAAAVLLELGLLSRLSFTTASPTLESVASSTTPVQQGKPNVEQLAEVIFTRYLLAFEVTSVLLVIAVVGAVVLARRVGDGPGADDPRTTEEAAA